MVDHGVVVVVVVAAGGCVLKAFIGGITLLLMGAFVGISAKKEKTRKKTPLRYSTHRIHVWHIYLHFVDLYGKCIRRYFK